MTAVIYGCYRSLAIGGFLFETKRCDSPLPYTERTLQQMDTAFLAKQQTSPIGGYSCVVWRRVASWEVPSMPTSNKERLTRLWTQH